MPPSTSSQPVAKALKQASVLMINAGRFDQAVEVYHRKKLKNVGLCQ
jgi:hypothetical protein